MREFISYAVGCMLGRYSLDKPGLILANQGETADDYRQQIPEPTFAPDEDNVIPLLDGDWFEDDITERFKAFLKVTFGTEHYEENLKFLEDALYPDNLTAKKRKTIRDYFLKEFYNHHIKLYKKRPIYWLFSSPKGTFNALIYMHRYRPDTVGTVLHYLRDFRDKLTHHADHQQMLADSASASKSEKTQAIKDVAAIKKQLKELEDYEKTLFEVAARKIDIDLDDGVKHNYLQDRVLAKYELEQIEAMPAASQTADDRYLVHRLNAKYLMLVGEFDEAAHRFLKAYDERPSLDQARINRALALELLGDKEKAWEQACTLLREGLRTEPLPSIVYRNAPRPHSDEVKGWYEDKLETSEELNLVMADEAREEGRPEDSIRFAERAIKINPDSGRGYVLRGFAFHNLALNSEPEQTAERLSLAENDYEHVLAMTNDPLPEGLLADVYRNLGNVRFLLGKPNAADAFEDAIAKADDKYPYVEQYLSFLCTRREFDVANQVLLRHGIDESDLNQRFLKLVVQRNDDKSKHHMDFAAAMADLHDQGDFRRRDECLGFIVQWSINDSKVEEGIATLKEMQDRVDPFEFACCMAWLQHVNEQDELAREHATVAKQLLAADSPPNYVALLARLFMDLGEDDQALPLLQQAADCTRMTVETRALLDCAQRMQQHDVMRDTCRLLRLNGADNEATRSMELQILYGYVPREAAELIRELIAKHPEDRGLYAWQCHIETRLNGRFEELDESRLPKADGLSVYEAERVLAPLLALERYSAGLRFAYDVLRHNQGDEIAHGRYLWLFMQFARLSDLELDPTVVRSDCAVTFRESGGVQKTVVIEDDRSDKRFDGDITSDHEFAVALKGKCVGDTVTISPDSLQPREITIESIASKFVYRYQTVFAEFQLNFPFANTIQMMHVLDGDELNLSPIQKSLEQRREHCDSVFALFRDQPLPIAALASWLGIGFYDAHGVLSSMPDIGIRAAFDPAPEQGLGFTPRPLAHGQHLLLDPSAVVTIEKLSLWGSLRDYPLVVTRSVLDNFAKEVEDLEGSRSEGTLTLGDSGQVAFQEISKDQHEERIGVARKIVENIEQHCEIVDSMSVASVGYELRETFDRAGAFPVLDSMAVAADRSEYQLWSDEAFVQATSQMDFKLTATGIQHVLAQLRADGTITHTQLDEFVAKLMGWNYTPIAWDADAAFAAARLSNWDPERWPFNAVIAQFRKRHWTLRAKCNTALSLFIKVYRSNAGSIRETRLLLAVMNAIGVGKAADQIHADAFDACRPNQKLLDSIRVSLEIWRKEWIVR
jgi:transcription elongation GreA/GreB family factor